jgi:hypothetical protein
MTFPNKAAFVKAKHLLEEIAIEWQKRRLLRRPLPGSKYNNSFPFMESLLDEAMHGGHMYFCRPHQSILGRSKKSLDDASQRSIYFISRGTAKVLDDRGSVSAQLPLSPPLSLSFTFFPSLSLSLYLSISLPLSLTLTHTHTLSLFPSSTIIWDKFSDSRKTIRLGTKT